MSKPQPGVIASLALFSPMPLTRHGSLRSQQRSISQRAIDLLVDFGDEEPVGAGCSRHFFTKRSWHAVSRHLGVQAKNFERYRSAYAVVSGDGQVVTVGWLH